MVVAKFRIVGEVQRADGCIGHVSQPEFWDTSKNTDPTIRVLTSVQFQFAGIRPDELAMLKVNVATNKGTETEHCQSGLAQDNVFVIEYASRWPMTVVVKNFLTNHETVFEVRWERKPHATFSDEYVFWLRVEKSEKSMEDIKSHLALAPDNGDGKGQDDGKDHRHTEEDERPKGRPRLKPEHEVQIRAGTPASEVAEELAS